MEHSPYWEANRSFKKFPKFYATRKFIAAFTSACYLSLSWARSIQSMLPTHFLKIHSNIILTSTPSSYKWSKALRYIVSFYGEKLSAHRPVPEAGGPRLDGCPRLHIQYIRSYPPHLEAVLPTTWESAMLWWQWPTYHGFIWNDWGNPWKPSSFEWNVGTRTLEYKRGMYPLDRNISYCTSQRYLLFSSWNLRGHKTVFDSMTMSARSAFYIN